MKAVASTYQPPRAGWVSRRFLSWYRLRRAMEARRFFLTEEPPSRGRLLLWLVLPGLVFLDRARDGFGIVCGVSLLLLWLAGLAVFVIWIGLPGSLLAIFAMSAAQAISAVAALQMEATQKDGRPRRIRAVLGAMAVTSLCAYLFQNQFMHRIVVPLVVRGSPVLMNPLRPTGTLHRGEWIAYRLFGQIAYGQLLAFAGDTVFSHSNALVVNGVAYPRPIPWMGDKGQIVVPKHSYLIWPQDLDSRWAHLAGNAEMGFFGIVKEDAIVGPAYRRWLWRKQELAPLVALKDWTPPAPKP